VWVEQPEGFEEGGREFAWRLLKALYGLRQAPRKWYQRLKATLEGLGFVECPGDPGLFTKGTGEEQVWVLVYVYDMLLVGKLGEAITAVKRDLHAFFAITDLGEASHFLGILLERDREAGTIRLSQQRLAQDVVAGFPPLEVARAKSVPLTHGTVLRAGEGEPLPNSGRYAELVGRLMYLATCTRPDLSYSLGVLARHMHAPTQRHWTAAMGVVRYLNGTMGLGLTYSRDGNPAISGFCDADYAGDQDTRRSTTGFVFMLAGGAVSWSSQRQRTVAVSTTEAEYQAAAGATKEALWLRHLAADMAHPVQSVAICSDNQAALTLLANPVLSQRSKHIDIQYHMARERVLRGEVSFSYIPTGEMVADFLTKAVVESQFHFCRAAVGLG
jgi:hypothetical protein